MGKLIDLSHRWERQSRSLTLCVCVCLHAWGGGCCHRFEIIFLKKVVGWVKLFSLPQEKLLDTSKPIF